MGQHKNCWQFSFGWKKSICTSLEIFFKNFIWNSFICDCVPRNNTQSSWLFSSVPRTFWPIHRLSTGRDSTSILTIWKIFIFMTLNSETSGTPTVGVVKNCNSQYRWALERLKVTLDKAFYMVFSWFFTNFSLGKVLNP